MSILGLVAQVTALLYFHGIHHNGFWHLQQISSKFEAFQKPKLLFPCRGHHPLHPPWCLTTGEHEQAAWDWLKNLDGGRGSLFGAL